jgi:lactoylglutathione lyase
MPAIQFGYTILYVQDVLRAVEFYEAAFDLQRRFIDPTGQYAELETGATALAFAAVELASSNLPAGFQLSCLEQPPVGIEISLVTEQVAAVFDQAVATGAVAVVAPKTKPWGQTVAYLRDPDGVLVALCSPMSE